MKLKILYLITLTLATFLVGCSSDIVQDQDLDTEEIIQPGEDTYQEFYDLLSYANPSYEAEYKVYHTRHETSSSTVSIQVQDHTIIYYEAETDYSGMSGRSNCEYVYDSGGWAKCECEDHNYNYETNEYELELSTDCNIKPPLESTEYDLKLTALERLRNYQKENIEVKSFQTTLDRTCYYLIKEEGLSPYFYCFIPDGRLVTYFGGQYRSDWGSSHSYDLDYPMDLALKEQQNFIYENFGGN